MYFVTLCTHDRIEWFGDVQDNAVMLNRTGKTVADRWQWLAQQYPYVNLGPYVIMPNHIHALITIQQPVGTGRDRSGPVATGPYRCKSLSGLIGAFKTTSSKAIPQSGHVRFRWQKSFYDSIIRNENSLFRVLQYIQENPQQWSTDSENPRINKRIQGTSLSVGP